ncbi:hypothetical protein Ddc_12958 [Ditylenchus destructor]|nr:hypothetical protein Ddc_12958 [Ditylenchus destructor]
MPSVSLGENTKPFVSVSSADFKTDAEKVITEMENKKGVAWKAERGSKFRAEVEKEILPGVVEACNADLKRDFEAMNQKIAEQRAKLEAEFESKKSGLLKYYRTRVVPEKINAAEKKREVDAVSRHLDPKFTAGWTGR